MKQVAPPSAATTKRFETLATTGVAAGVVKSAMFGMPSLKVGGKAFAGLFGDALVFKLTGATHAEALALKGAVLFDPSGSGRAMKEWVVVPAAHAARWAALAEAAREFVASGNKPAVKKKKR